MPKRFHMIPRKDIDVERWDHCVNSSPNGLIYSTSMYLDAMAENWMGIVSDDYSFVCAVPWKRKYGFSYVYTPLFIQQLGLIGQKVTNDTIRDAALLMNSEFLFGDYLSNFNNLEGTVIRSNLTLKLDQPFDQIRAGYTSELNYNLKRAAGKLSYEPSEDFNSPIDAFSKLYGSRISHIQERHYDDLKRLLSNLSTTGSAFIRKAVSKEEDQCTIICLKYQNRIYLLLTVVQSEGRNLRATHFLINKIIQEFSNTGYILDFEGSDLPGVKHFYTTFGTHNEPYFFYHWDRLPWPVNMLKRSFFRKSGV